ncbi:adenosylcobinamide-phosphate synthase CbiB [Falsigemmobacter faecalis]|uniref:Cobalamin biosynthesis protein CobD n=1 Tax=Falsigemmobacter faecalis TaxID=2488730 RepID=A0A3P3DCJ4_9RHOB|nr:adenosylcobinamide-phosphate synthase CbiB [Falsigemmobacter faecalis]RRH72049.1 cobalamin biosynthesis protein CobD [Falsigemmobacter faecalis]
MSAISENLLGLILALSLDLLLGWPAWLYRRIGHPVGWLAAPVTMLETLLNKPCFSDARRFVSGTALTLAGIASAGLIWAGLTGLTGYLPLTPVWLAILFWPFIAARSMYDHIEAVAIPLEKRDLSRARNAVSMIVGRDPSQLDQAGVSRAALESLGENTSDGIIAPIFWGVLFGPAGMAAYKAINTFDSMIAHRNSRFEWFGKSAARIDDVANLLPARLTGLLYALTAGRRVKSILNVMWRDAGSHRSPNAGWPESALAAALNVRLSGPRVYDGVVSPEPWLNGEGPDPDGTSLRRGLMHYRRLLALTAGCLLGLTALAHML